MTMYPFKLTADVHIPADSAEEAQQKADGLWRAFAQALEADSSVSLESWIDTAIPAALDTGPGATWPA